MISKRVSGLGYIFFRLTEEINALDYLEQSYHYIQQVEKDALAWKWVVLTLHGALYGFAICALKGTSPNRVKDMRWIPVGLKSLPNEVSFPQDISPWGMDLSPPVIEEKIPEIIALVLKELEGRGPHCSQ